MEVKFIKASPTENMTLLIETPVAREKQLAVAERLIAYGSVYAEQAGYIEEAEKKLESSCNLLIFRWVSWYNNRRLATGRTGGRLHGLLLLNISLCSTSAPIRLLT